MRFRQTGMYAGKGQKDLGARAASLMSLGDAEFPRNKNHPHMFDRRAVLAAERARGLMWYGRTGEHGPIAPAAEQNRE